MKTCQKLLIYELLWALPLVSLRSFCCFPGFVAYTRLHGPLPVAALTVAYTLVGLSHPALGAVLSLAAGWSYAYGCCPLPGLLESQAIVVLLAYGGRLGRRRLLAASITLGAAVYAVETLLCSFCHVLAG